MVLSNVILSRTATITGPPGVIVPFKIRAVGGSACIVLLCGRLMPLSSPQEVLIPTKNTCHKTQNYSLVDTPGTSVILLPFQVDAWRS